MSINYLKNKKLFHYILILIFSAISILINPINTKVAAISWGDSKGYFSGETLQGDRGTMFRACDGSKESDAPIFRVDDFINPKTKKPYTDQKAKLLAYIRGYQTNEDAPDNTEKQLDARNKDSYLNKFPTIAKYTYCTGDINQNRNVGGANFIMAQSLNKYKYTVVGGKIIHSNIKNPSKKNDSLFTEFAKLINKPEVKVSWITYTHDRNSSSGFIDEAGKVRDWGFYEDTEAVETLAISINPEGSDGNQVLFGFKAHCGNFVYNTKNYNNFTIYDWSVTLSEPKVSPKTLAVGSATSAKWTYGANISDMSSGPTIDDIDVYSSDQDSPKKLTKLGTIKSGADEGYKSNWEETFKDINSKTCRRSDILSYAYGSYVVTESGTKQILEKAKDHERHSSYTCIDTYLTAKWAITLDTTVDKTNPDIGDEVTFTHKATVTSSKALPIDIDVYYQNSIRGELSEKVKLLTLPAGSKMKTAKSSTNKIKITESGDYCSQALSNNGKGVYIQDKTPIEILSTEIVSSIRKCANVNRTPTVGIKGGDLTVGKGPTASLISKIVVNNKSFVEYGVFSTGANMLMASGTSSPLDNANCEYSKLTFSNIKDGNICGGDYTVKSLMRNYSSLFPTNSTISSDKTEIDLKDYLSGDRYKSLSYTGGNLKIKSARQITNSIVINAPDTTITISENINRKKTDLTTSTIPQVVIIAKNIKISEAVTNIDAWLISPNGYLTTCDSSATDNPKESVVSISKCNNNLDINGPIVTGRIYLLRTQTSDGPSETISLPADTFIWEYNRSRQNTRYFHTTYTKELPPRL